MAEERSLDEIGKILCQADSLTVEELLRYNADLVRMRCLADSPWSDWSLVERAEIIVALLLSRQYRR